MGSGGWKKDDFVSYTATKCMAYDTATRSISGSYSAQEMFKSRSIDPELNPYNVIREACDSDEHPESFPVILALDVTGSMGKTAVEIAKKINVVMTDLYDKVPHVQFMIMGIGDLDYDRAPIQASQFESDIRIAVQLDKIYFEGGGGGNSFESYTAAWYFGSRHTKLDCWKRGKKGVIITMGDETLNPYLPYGKLRSIIGDSLQGNIETSDLYKEVTDKFDVYHLAISSTASYRYLESRIKDSFTKYMDEDHFRIASLNEVAGQIVDIVESAYNSGKPDVCENNTDNNGYISW